MNVGLVVPGFSANHSDWCIPALLDFVRTLAATDRVRVFALRYPYTEEPYEVFGARVVPFAGRERAGLRRYPLLWRVTSAIVDAHLREPFDLIHAIWADEPGWVGAAAASRLAVPLVVSLGGGELEHRPRQQYGAQRSWFGRVAVERSLRRADYWTVGSKYLMARVLEKVRGIDAARGVLAPAGVDLKLFSASGFRLPASGSRTKVLRPEVRSPEPEARGKLTQATSFPQLPEACFSFVLSVASLTPIKNLDLLVRAFRLVRDARPDAQLHLVGDGPMREALEQERDALGLRDAVIFHGARPHDELPGYYRQAAVTVVASYHESQCLAAVEAAACGCPVVGFPVGIIPELGEGARVIPERSEDCVAKTIVGVLEDQRTGREMGRCARQAAEAQFELQKSVDRIRGIYADAMARRPRRAETMPA